MTLTLCPNFVSTNFGCFEAMIISIIAEREWSTNLLRAVAHYFVIVTLIGFLSAFFLNLMLTTSFFHRSNLPRYPKHGWLDFVARLYLLCDR